LANVIGGLLTIPVVLGFGILSDRLGRRLFLGLGYLLAAIGGISLMNAERIWQFWVVAAAILISRTISGSLASALATDILPHQALGRSLPVLGTMAWASGVMGFAGSGYVIESLGANVLYLIVALMSLAAVGLIWIMPRKDRRDSSIQNSSQLEYIPRPNEINPETRSPYNNDIIGSSAPRRI